jgi:hypothetical protein
MNDWYKAQQKKPATVAEKRSIFEHHLRGLLGAHRLDQIDVGVVQGLKAAMNAGGNRYGKPLALKTCKNVLGILSNALKGAAEVDLIDEAPRSRAYKSERPETECWDLDEWRRVVTTARN